ncbi:hypothetical protein [Spirosoma lituiforme]
MKLTVRWLPSLLIVATACSRPFTMTASVNNAPWYGSGQIRQALSQDNKSCFGSRFSVGARTDIPYPKTGSTAKKPTGCVQDCLPTQWLDFYNLPLQKGKHYLTLADSCLSPTTRRAQLLIEQFSITTSYQFLAGDQGWVELVKYNPTTGLIKGRFDLTVTNSKGQSIHLKKGKFNGMINR